MPVDEYIEDLTDGTPAVEGDLFVLQRNVAGVWTDFFIRSEKVARGWAYHEVFTDDKVDTYACTPRRTHVGAHNYVYGRSGEK